MNLPPLNHDDLGLLKSVIDKLKRMRKREHHHRGHTRSMEAEYLDEAITNLKELHDWIGDK